MPEDKKTPPPAAEPTDNEGCRFPDLEAVQREVELRIRDNRRFLEKFLDENYVDEVGDEEEEQTEEEL